MSEPTYIAFRVGQAGYAVEVSRVREVIRPGKRVLVPYAPAVIWGALNHRGRVYAAVDTSLWVSNGAAVWEPSDESRAILLDLPGHQVALLVDAIETIGPADQTEDDVAGKLDEGAARIGGIRVRLLDTKQLVGELDRMIEHVVRARSSA